MSAGLDASVTTAPAWLERYPDSKKSSHALGAANIRRELQRAFPGVDFRVTSKTFSMGDSISIHWTLGPTSKEVEAISNKYQQGYFDGMNDIYEYTNREWPSRFGGSKYVHASRDEGPGVVVIARALCKEYGLEEPMSESNFWSVCLPNDRQDIGNLARQILFNQSYPPGAVVTGIERTGITCGAHAEFFRVLFRDTQPAPATAPDPSPTDGARVSVNRDKRGVEIRFPSKPAASVLDGLKSHGWRWSRFSSCWYHTASETALDFALAAAGLNGEHRAALLAEVQALDGAGPDRFDMQVEDNMRDACGA